MPEVAASLTISYGQKSFAFPEPAESDHIHRKIKGAGRFYEETLLSYLERHISGPGTAIDCGANIGNHTLFFAGVMGLRTLAVEPVPRNHQILRQAIDLNALSDVAEIVPKALAETPGKVNMVLDNPGNFGMFKVGDGQGQIVEATTLDLLAADLGDPVKLVKIDVEGFQDNVIRGATEMLGRDKPLIAAELASTQEYQSFFGLIEKIGYVPVEVFNRTPTIIFCADGSLPDGRSGVEAKLKAFERRMIIAGPIQRILGRFL